MQIITGTLSLQRDTLIESKFDVVRDLNWNKEGYKYEWRLIYKSDPNDLPDLVKSLTTYSREQTAIPVPLNHYY